MNITLTGDALCGIGRHFCAAAIDGLPETVCLGRIRAKARPPALRFSSFFDELRATGKAPDSVDYYTKAAQSIARMLGNDRLGDCVIASLLHRLGVYTANDPDSGGIVVATDQEAVSQYRDFCGPGDRGCNIADVLDIARSAGYVAAGKRYKIDAYVSIDWTRKELVKAAIDLFGALCLGINLPSAWTQNSIWDVTNTAIVGGHDVPAVGYGDGVTVLASNKDGVVIASWGRLYLITWPAFTSTRWIEECYAILSPNWYNNDRLSPGGVDVEALKADLAKLAGGVIPDVPDPNNPPDTTDWFV